LLKLVKNKIGLVILNGLVVFVGVAKNIKRIGMDKDSTLVNIRACMI
jgi:hypothetical protein